MARGSGAPRPTANLIAALFKEPPDSSAFCNPHAGPSSAPSTSAGSPPDAMCPCGSSGPQSLNQLCQDAAAKYPGMDWVWLRAIAAQESGSCGYAPSFDVHHGPSYGIFQINARAHNLSPKTLVDDCRFNAAEAAYLLNDAMKHHPGDTTGMFAEYFLGYGFLKHHGLDVAPPHNVDTGQSYADKILGFLHGWGAQ